MSVRNQYIIQITNSPASVTKAHEQLDSVDRKITKTNQRIKQTTRNYNQTRAKILLGLSALTSGLSLYTALTGQTINMAYLSMISSLIQLQATIGAFEASFAAMGMWAYIPVLIAAAAFATTTIVGIQSEQARTQALQGQNAQDIMNGLEDF